MTPHRRALLRILPAGAESGAGCGAGADGVNFDIEGAEAVLLDGHYETYTFPIGGGQTQTINTTRTADGLTALLKELRTEGRKRISPHFQISFCYPVYPAQPQLAVAYDIAAISEVIDFFVPMGCEQHSALSVHALLSTLWLRPDDMNCVQMI